MLAKDYNSPKIWLMGFVKLANMAKGHGTCHRSKPMKVKGIKCLSNKMEEHYGLKISKKKIQQVIPFGHYDKHVEGTNCNVIQGIGINGLKSMKS